MLSNYQSVALLKLLRTHTVSFGVTQKLTRQQTRPPVCSQLQNLITLNKLAFHHSLALQTCAIPATHINYPHSNYRVVLSVMNHNDDIITAAAESESIVSSQLIGKGSICSARTLHPCNSLARVLLSLGSTCCAAYQK